MIINSFLPSGTQLGSITTSTTWSGNDPYTQVVTIDYAIVSKNSKIDLQPDASLISSLSSAGITAMYVENNDGVFMLYTIGGFLSSPITIQCTVTEVVPKYIKNCATVTMLLPSHSGGTIAYYQPDGTATYLNVNSSPPAVIKIDVKKNTNIIVTDLYSQYLGQMSTTAPKELITWNGDSANIEQVYMVFIEGDTSITYS